MLAAIVAAAGLAACGSSRSGRPVTLVLDFVPNAVHAGIYRAIAAGYYRADDIDLRVIKPASTANTLSLIEAGQAQFGLADGSDVAQQIALGRDAQAVAALVQAPLGGVIALASEHLSSARALEGRKVGVTGVPSDLATLDTVVTHAGGNPRKVGVVTIGFGGVQDLAAGKIAAFTGFWPDDGVALAETGHPIQVFRLDRDGGPAYPGLVVFTTRSEIRSRPGLVRAFLAATVKGYQDTIRDPARSLHDLLSLNPGLDAKLTRASLAQYLPLFTDRGAVAFGVLRRSAVVALVAWMRRYRLIAASIAPSRYGTNAYLPVGG